MQLCGGAGLLSRQVFTRNSFSCMLSFTSYLCFDLQTTASNIYLSGIRDIGTTDVISLINLNVHWKYAVRVSFIVH